MKREKNKCCVYVLHQTVKEKESTRNCKFQENRSNWLLNESVNALSQVMHSPTALMVNNVTILENTMKIMRSLRQKLQFMMKQTNYQQSKTAVSVNGVTILKNTIKTMRVSETKITIRN
uniref:Uncharacterized protein n=1 Tax=Rhizophora mucronata TaxID=61149 RepID=A0A2P2M3E7_RHIMU